MPILIRELHIKVSVNAPEGSAAASAAGYATTPASSASGPEERDRLVTECVEQVLDILKSQQEA